MRIKCPFCGSTGSIGDEHSGREVRCPKCEMTFIAPKPTTAIAHLIPAIEVDEVPKQTSQKRTTQKKRDAADVLYTLAIGYIILNFLCGLTLPIDETGLISQDSQIGIVTIVNLFLFGAATWIYNQYKTANKK